MDNRSLRLRLWKTIHLPKGGMGKGEMPSPLPCPSMPVTVGELDLRSQEWGKWYCTHLQQPLTDLASKLGSTRIQTKGT